MVSARSLLLIFLSSVPLLASARVVPRSTIEWGPCSELDSYIAKIPIECGTLAVPLDYTQPDRKTVNLQLPKFLAPKQPSRGTIQLGFFNPGEEAGGAARRHVRVLQKYINV